MTTSLTRAANLHREARASRYREAAMWLDGAIEAVAELQAGASGTEAKNAAATVEKIRSVRDGLLKEIEETPERPEGKGMRIVETESEEVA